MLTGSAIIKAIKNKEIQITPFDISCINPNSYNVHLANTLKIYTEHRVLDTREKNKPDYERTIPEEGFILYPGKLYIGSIAERVKSNFYISAIDGRSSIGRLGLQIHATAGFGDIGFDGHYTLEMIATVPVRVYPNDLIGQLYFEKPDGDVDFLYNGRYQHQVDPTCSRIEIDSRTIKGYHYVEQQEKDE